MTEPESPEPPEVVTHGYLSTACHHGRHTDCRMACKFCDAPCRCEHHTAPGDLYGERSAS